MNLTDETKVSYMPKSKSDIHLTPDRVWDMIRENFGYLQEEFFDPCPHPRTEDDGLLVDFNVPQCYERDKLYEMYQMNPWGPQVDDLWVGDNGRV